ncbi:aspartate aminotransferase family protein [Paraburkholderia sp. BR14263]|uniref:pyridoxal phosphate-dependent decarboxylase family protein n=1 Tax=unclassified Paraburkholderia TaxID=2615204 RepID=UPI0034CDB842
MDPSDALATAYAIAVDFHTTRLQHSPNASASVSQLLEAFDGPFPESPAAADQVVHQLVRTAEPGLMGTAGGRFFGWVVGASHPAGVAADWLTSVWGQNGASFASCPANAVAEHVAGRWLCELLRLPPECSIGFTTGATMANFVCLAAARNELLRKAGWDVEAEGLFGAPRVGVYIGEDAHVSVLASLRYLGFGEGHAVRIPTDQSGRMREDVLHAALANATEPALVIAQAGQINTGAFDPVDAIAEITHARQGWLHVDGAFGLWARACPATAHLANGIEKADSWATDGHKWLQAPYDAGYGFVRNAEAHRHAMSSEASYFISSEQDVRDPRSYVPELSRRARGFATWAIISTLGRQGIAEMIECHCEQARAMSESLAKEPGVYVLNKVELNQFVVRFGSPEPSESCDQLTKAVVRRVQSSGICFVAGAAWKGTWVMRISIISWPTTSEDVDQAVDAITGAWRCVRDAAGT